MVKWTPKAESDLDELREYLAENFDVETAIRISNKLIDYTENLLSQYPLAGKIFEPNPLFSSFVFQGNVIYYCENPQDKNIYIIYVQFRKQQFSEDRLEHDENVWNNLS